MVRWLAALFVAAPLFALDVPAGTAIPIRLNAKVSSQTSQPGDPVDAVVIAAVMASGQYAIPAGAVVHGSVIQASPAAEPDTRATLLVSFKRIDIGGASVPCAARVAGVDNAREKVDQAGQINGILASETITGKIDNEISKIGESHSGLAGLLGAVKGAVLKQADTEINYGAGVEMTIQLTAALHLRVPGGAGPRARLSPMPEVTVLRRLIAGLPSQAVAQKPPKPSDLTNLILIGSREDVQQAFADAGWSAANPLSRKAKYETLTALGEDRGYNEAPVSVLLLDGKPPDLVFEKLTDTFARRHHLRIWLTGETFLGQPVWAAAATHDVGISFSEANRTFIHRVEGHIDEERAKVANDLIFTGRVRSETPVDRGGVPRTFQNATGDTLQTDGRIDVLLLQ
jgi:hypothetical protein